MNEISSDHVSAPLSSEVVSVAGSESFFNYTTALLDDNQPPADLSGSAYVQFRDDSRFWVQRVNCPIGSLRSPLNYRFTNYQLSITI